MNEQKSNQEEKTVLPIFGVPEDRADDIAFEIDLIMHEISKPTRNPVPLSPSDIINRFRAIAMNDAEKGLCFYLAGRTVADMFCNCE